MSAAPKCDSEPMQWFNPVPASLARVQARRYHFCGGSAGATSAADSRRDRIRNIANRKYIRNIRFLLISNERITIVVQFQLLAEQLRVWFNPDSNHYTLHRHLKWFQCIFSEYFDPLKFLPRCTSVTVGQTSANNKAFSAAASPPPITQTSLPANSLRSLLADSITPFPTNSFSPGIPSCLRFTPVAMIIAIDCNSSPLRRATRFGFKSTLSISTFVQRSKSASSIDSEKRSRNSHPLFVRSPG